MKKEEFASILQSPDAQAGQSVFNSGLIKLNRIDMLRKGIHSGRIMRDYQVVGDCLAGLASELFEFMTDEQKAELEAHESKLWKELREMATRKKIELKAFINFERFLALVEHQSGLGMPTKRSREFSIGDME